uniref:Uncharacterized protein n=1 Tax=Kalanchoe fedtschenkoi TaxID=63787 RepID=A0A7N0V4B0_KALFE
MRETTSLNFCSNSIPPPPRIYRPSSFSRPRSHLFFPPVSSRTAISLPPKPPNRILDIPSITVDEGDVYVESSTSAHDEFEEKLLYLESIGLDFLSLVDRHPVVASCSLSDVKSTVEFIQSMGFSSAEFRRIFNMCPETLTAKVSEILPVFTFLLREVKVQGSDLRKVVNRRPRLLACSVEERLRPTLYFLQSIGIVEVRKHTYLLSCSVEDKLLPRIEYLEKTGFEFRDALSMVRRFPQLFCYSIKGNLEPKFDYFVVEMRRELKELKDFPHYFSFSLENRIKPRHRICKQKGVCFPLKLMLKPSEVEFLERLDVFYNSSIPFRTSPLWRSSSLGIEAMQNSV